MSDLFKKMMQKKQASFSNEMEEGDSGDEDEEAGDFV